MIEMGDLSRFLSNSVSRRDFLKLSGGGLLSLALAPGMNALHRAGVQAERDDVPTQGRVTDNDTGLFERPSVLSKKLKTYYKDLILPISAITVGDDEDSYNRVWYQVNNEGYVPSGKVQPVEVKLNDPDFNILPEGRLAKVTVPFTDSVEEAGKPSPVIYRLYYGTTYWVVKALMDDAREPWYMLKDDYFKEKYYFVNARHLHLFTTDRGLSHFPECAQGSETDRSAFGRPGGHRLREGPASLRQPGSHRRGVEARRILYPPRPALYPPQTTLTPHDLRIP